MDANTAGATERSVLKAAAGRDATSFVYVGLFTLIFVASNAAATATIAILATVFLFMLPVIIGRVSISAWMLCWLATVVLSELFSDYQHSSQLLVSTVAAFIVGISARAFIRWKRFVSLLAFVLILISGVSILSGILGVEGAITSDVYQNGTLSGIYPHRNLLGFVSGLAVIVGIVGGVERSLGRLVALVCGSAGVVALIWTGSVSAIVGTGIVLSAYFALHAACSRPLSRRLIVALAVLSCTVALGLLVVMGVSSALSLFGRDATYTGRDSIWLAVLGYIPEVPFFGLGWGVPWQGVDTVTSTIRAHLGFDVAHAHQGFFDVALRSGVISALFLAVGLVSLAVRYCRSALVSAKNDARLLFCVVLLILIRSFVESDFHLTYVAFLLGVLSCTPLDQNQDQSGAYLGGLFVSPAGAPLNRSF